MTSVSPIPTSMSHFRGIQAPPRALGPAAEPTALRPVTADRLVAATPRAPSPLLFEAEFLAQYAKDIAAAAPKDPYAYIYKNGEKFGELGNDGSASLNSAIPNVDWSGGPGQGPALAQWRADQLKKAGFTIVKAETALEADEWKPWTPPSVDARALDAYVKAAATEWAGNHKVDGAT